MSKEGKTTDGLKTHKDLDAWNKAMGPGEAPLKTVLFRDGGVSRVLKSSCIRPYTPVFRARLPCPHEKFLVFRGALNVLTFRHPKEETYGLTSQIRRSAISIPSNIAEGAARNSKKEFIQYLHIALGSLAELETQLILADRLKFSENNQELSQIAQLRQILLGLLRHLKGKLAESE